MKIDRDAFEEWQAHPITEAFFKSCVRWAEESKANWVEMSWNGNKPDAVHLATMKERARVFEQIREMTAEAIEEALK